MRKRFEVQTVLGLTPISDIKFPKGRDELIPTLRGLQHIFTTPDLNEKVFTILEKKIPLHSLGRSGMDLWCILVIGVCRLTLDADYDRMWHIANFDGLVRLLMQTPTNNFTGEEPRFSLQTIKDNLMLLDEATIQEINELVVDSAHDLVLKKNEKLHLKSDTFVLETNIHYPTDTSLLLDSLRKALTTCKKLQDKFNFTGARKYNDSYNKLKYKYKNVGKVNQSKSKNKDLSIKQVANDYCEEARKIVKSCENFILKNTELILNIDQAYTIIDKDLKFYLSMGIKHIDLVDRRLIKGEIIPTSEKVYSIFELHTEWKSKGKAGVPVEFGHNILVTSDQFNFIVNGKVVERECDSELVVSLVDGLQRRYPSRIQSISFDKGFYSKENRELVELEIPEVIMPKKGKLNAAEKEKEGAKAYKKLRFAHSAIESNINQLEHHGLNKCFDKGLVKFKVYVQLGILSYNLNKLGKILLERQIPSMGIIKKAS